MAKSSKKGPVDPYLRALAHGLDGSEDQELILFMLTQLVRDEKKLEARADLREVLAVAGVYRGLLVRTFWKVVQLGLPVLRARGDRENASERAYWKKVAPDIIPVLRWLESEPDDRLAEYAYPLRRRLEELKDDPSRWKESWSVPAASLVRRPPGSPLFAVALRREAHRLLEQEANAKDKATRLRYLRFLGIEPSPRGRRTR